MSTLDRAIAIATEAHAGQVDKAGADYILHPMRVAFSMEPGDPRIAAVLHDVVEDTDWTLDRLRAEGFSDAVVSAVDAVTKREGESYSDCVARAGRDPIARQVKRADLIDNMDTTRLGELTDKDRERLGHYMEALAQLDGIRV
jgi:(p)ppGpp synthase/HD superfamily hydrolase